MVKMYNLFFFSLWSSLSFSQINKNKGLELMDAPPGGRGGGGGGMPVDQGLLKHHSSESLDTRFCLKQVE